MGEGLHLQPGQQHLTPEQEVAVRRFALEQIAAQFSTEPVNEAEAEAWLRAAYQVAGLRPPSTIIWLDNPLQFMALVLLQSVRMAERVWEQVWERVMDCLSESGEAREWERLWTGLWESVLQSVQASVGQDVWNSAGDRVRAGLLEPGTRASVLDQVSSSLQSSV